MELVSRLPEMTVKIFSRSDSMNIVYPVVFTETDDKENPVLVYIPDINGMTEGKDIAEAISMAKDYICNSLFDKKDSEIPAARRIDEIDLKESPFFDSGNSFASLVDVDLNAFRLREKSRSVRRNITLPQWLDDMATSAKLNVSAVTQSALKKELGIA